MAQQSGFPSHPTLSNDPSSSSHRLISSTLQHPSYPPGPSSPAPPAPPASGQRQKHTTSRSAVACDLCRSQKMKCEGPSQAPCKRCVKNNQQCVFSESQGRARQILWTKTANELEQRMAFLEDDLKQTKARVDRIEARISALDPALAQDRLRKRRLSGHSQDELPDEPGCATGSSGACVAGATAGPTPTLTPTPTAGGASRECGPVRKAIPPIQCAQPGPRRPDAVDRGILTKPKAEELFELHRKLWAPQIAWLNLPDTFDNVRTHSPLMLAVGCSAGAKGCRDVEMYRKLKAHAMELLIDVVCYRFFAHDIPQSYQDVIAVIGCIVHCGLSLDPAWVVDYAEHLRLRDVFDRIREPKWQSEPDQRQLLSIARTFIGVYIQAVLFSTLEATPCVMKIQKSVLILYCQIICESPYSLPEWDGNLKYFIEYYSIMAEAQTELDSHFRLGGVNISERLGVIGKYTGLVEEWKANIDFTAMSVDALSEFEHMYHRGITFLVCYATSDAKNGKEIESNPRRLSLAQQGVKHGLVILEKFIESRKAKPDVPCVHLEYRKSTTSIATACIMQACIHIPKHVDYGRCRRVIGALTEEVEKEGGMWGVGTEDVYVTTLKKLLVELDTKRSRRAPASAVRSHDCTKSAAQSSDASPLLTPVGLPHLPSLPAQPPPARRPSTLDALLPLATSQSTAQGSENYGGNLQTSAGQWVGMMKEHERSETPPTSDGSYGQMVTGSERAEPMSSISAWLSRRSENEAEARLSTERLEIMLTEERYGQMILGGGENMERIRPPILAEGGLGLSTDLSGWSVGVDGRIDDGQGQLDMFRDQGGGDAEPRVYNGIMAGFSGAEGHRGLVDSRYQTSAGFEMSSPLGHHHNLTVVSGGQSQASPGELMQVYEFNEVPMRNHSNNGLMVGGTGNVEDQEFATVLGPGQTRELLEALRNVYPDRYAQYAFQRIS